VGIDFGLSKFLTLSDSKDIEASLKIANQRKDYFHKLANMLKDNYDKIFIEYLNIKAMQILWGRKVSDLAFSEFINILSYKANVIKIDRYYK
jgi:putative transposase